MPDRGIYLPDLFSLPFIPYYRISCYRCNAEIFIGLAVPTHCQPTFVGRFMGQVGFFFYPGDWDKDTRVLTLQCRGAWIDLLGEIWAHDGTVSWYIPDFARFWGCSEIDAQSILSDLGFYKTANIKCDCETVSAICPGFVRRFSGVGHTVCHGIVTVVSRRAQRELKERENARLRKEAERQRKARHRNVTDMSHENPGALPSPSPSPSLFKSQKDTLVDETFSVRDLVDSWNDVFKNRLPSVEWPLSTSRQRKAAARIKEHRNIEFWQKVFDRIGESRFLLGQGNGTWRCTLDFLVANDTNCVKIFEGSYNNGPQINQQRRFGQ